MVKCSLCGNKVEETFLGKIEGTYVGVSRKEFKAVCSDCQKKHKDLKELVK